MPSSSRYQFTPLIVFLGISFSSGLALTSERPGNSNDTDCIKPREGAKSASPAIPTNNSVLLPPEVEGDPVQKTASINITVKPIFDENIPKENNWLFSLTNRLHFKTRKSVVADDILVRAGQPFDQSLADASERTLNTRRYLSRANVDTLDTPCGKAVNVEVHDVWTLKPKLSFSHSGGNSNSSYGFEDSNFLGTGKALSVMQFSDEMRSGHTIDYNDPNTGAYNSKLRLRYSDNDDGVEKNLQLNIPFLDLSTKWTANLAYNDSTFSESTYSNGEKSLNFSQHQSQNSIYYGRRIDRLSKDNDYASRFIFGAEQNKDVFTPLDIIAQTNMLPEDRADNSVWLEYQNVHDGFIKTSNVKQINRAEYFNLGNQFRARFGYAASTLNDNKDGYIIQAENIIGEQFSDNHLLLHQIGFNGRYTDDGLLDSVLETELSYYWKNIDRGQFLTQISASKGYGLYSDEPIELDGESGMRGYPSHFQTGDRKVLFTMEQHFFGEREWLSLFHAGAAVFFDAGRAWGDKSNSTDDTGWVKDVGVGLRFSPTRTGNKEEGVHNVLHLDLVKPLDRTDDISAYQWRLKTEKRF
jgi:hypothetical protein